MRRTDDEILMRRYLLGSLPQDERTSLEVVIWPMLGYLRSWSPPRMI